MLKAVKENFLELLIELLVPALILAGIIYFLTSGIFSGLSTGSISDLSKVIIQTVGILASLLAVASFFYLGKLEDDAIKLLDNLFKQIVNRRSLELRLLHMNSRVDLLKERALAKCRKCEHAEECKAKDEISPYFDKMKRNKDLITKDGTEDLAAMPTEIKKIFGRYDSKAIIRLTSSLCVLFLSILLAIFAYVDASTSLLISSIILVAIGTLFFFLTWSTMYSSHRTLREWFFDAMKMINMDDVVRAIDSYLSEELDLTLQNMDIPCKFPEPQSGRDPGVPQ